MRILNTLPPGTLPRIACDIVQRLILVCLLGGMAYAMLFHMIGIDLGLSKEDKMWIMIGTLIAFVVLGLIYKFKPRNLSG